MSSVTLSQNVMASYTSVGMPSLGSDDSASSSSSTSLYSKLFKINHLNAISTFLRLIRKKHIRHASCREMLRLLDMNTTFTSPTNSFPLIGNFFNVTVESTGNVDMFPLIFR